MALTTEQVLAMMDSSGESDIEEDPAFLLPHESDSEEESIVASTSATFPAPHNGTQETIASSIEDVLSGIIHFFPNNTYILLPASIHNTVHLVKYYDKFRWIFGQSSGAGQRW